MSYPEKRVLLLIFMMTAFVASCSQNGRRFIIEGSTGFGKGRAVLTYKTPEGVPVNDTVILKNGRFKFSGSTNDVVRGLLSLIPDEGKGFASTIYIENAHVIVEVDTAKAVDDGMFGDLPSIHEPRYRGGRNNTFFSAFSALGPDREARKSLIADSPDVEAAAAMFRIYFADSPLEEYDSLLNSFSKKVQDSFLAREAKQELAARKRVAPGRTAPDFTLKDMDGNDFTLSSLRGSYVLLDFWASWCAPCRAGVPALKSLYAKYHSKGLEVVGISNDVYEQAWRKAIDDDATPWIHVRDVFPVQGGRAEVASSYAVHYIPCFFLLDKDGKIVVRQEHGQLEELLANLIVQDNTTN